MRKWKASIYIRSIIHLWMKLRQNKSKLTHKWLPLISHFKEQKKQKNRLNREFVNEEYTSVASQIHDICDIKTNN